MSENYQNSITDQICKVQTSKKLIALYDRLRYTSYNSYAQLHAKGEFEENGHKVLINTGRPLVYFEKEILDIGCDGYLCSNGVHILLDGETIYHKTVPETVVEQIKRICEENNIYGTFEGEKCSYFRDHNVDFHPHYGFMITAFDLAPYMAHEFTWDHVEILIKPLYLQALGAILLGL